MAKMLRQITEIWVKDCEDGYLYEIEKKTRLYLVSQVEFATLEIRKTKPLTSMLENTDMDIILRITMEPQSVNLIFIFWIITTSNYILTGLFSYQQRFNNKFKTI